MAPATPAISAARLSKNYGQHVALASLDLAVERGQVFGLIGPNGAGKTTTMRLLLDLVRPSSGSVRVLGEEPRTGSAALRRRVGYLPGELRLQTRTTGRDLLGFYARISAAERDTAAVLRRARGLADRLGLELDRQVGTLSKGNKQKLGLVQAFMHAPELLILDEPTSGLDPLVQNDFLQLVREARSAGQTVFLSSHVLSEVQAVADKVALLSRGRLTRLATVPQLRAQAPRRLRLTVPRSATEAALRALAEVPGVTGLTLENAESASGVIVGQLTGTAGGLLRALGPLTVEDLVLEEPNLGDAVLGLYQPGGDA